MHYYQFNIADYRKDTAHLSLVEHGIYRQLLDTYYLSEQPLTDDLDKLMRTHCIRSADEKQSLCNVLADFFERTESGYIHNRCDADIKQFHNKSDKARRSAEARWSNKNNDLMRTHSDGSANGMLTNNHKPITSNKEKQVKEKPRSRFSPPTKQQLIDYQQEAGLNFDEDKFIDYYEANGWMVGRTKMKDWKAAARNWNKRQAEYQNEKAKHSDKHNSYLAELGF